MPEIARDINSRKTTLGHSDRVLAQNFDAVLAILAGGLIVATQMSGYAETRSKTLANDI